MNREGATQSVASGDRVIGESGDRVIGKPKSRRRGRLRSTILCWDEFVNSFRSWDEQGGGRHRRNRTWSGDLV